MDDPKTKKQNNSTKEKTSKKDKIKLNEEDYKEVKVPSVKIQNIVVSADLHAIIDLFNLSQDIKEVDYEPEQFPGAIFRVSNPKAVLILFKNGKMICTGASTEADIKRVLEYAAKVISKYVLEVPEEKQAKSESKDSK
ncbi:MAG: TATA box-binding protein [Candidatus Micrarchaeia archaeon]